nr:GDSL esterase/lipase At1g29670-like [Ipomoea batatas]
MFVFGSSLVDNGNNNNLIDAIAKADYLPYGVDFPGGASGRFTNGKNVIDLLGQHLQLPAYIPPFTHPSTRGPNIVHGVNYASGGSGILDDTGAVLVRSTSFNHHVMGQSGSKLTQSPRTEFREGRAGNNNILNMPEERDSLTTASDSAYELEVNERKREMIGKQKGS